LIVLSGGSAFHLGFKAGIGGLVLIWSRLASLVGGSGGSKLFRLAFAFGYCNPDRVDVDVERDWYGADLVLNAACLRVGDGLFRFAN
jgi:hypothetical protein